MLVQLNPQNLDIKIDLAYATKNNFTHKILYTAKLTDIFLHEKAAHFLSIASKQARMLNLYLKVWDAFRPIEVQHLLWQTVPDENYVSPPSTGICAHCRGCAIDLTLCDEQENNLDMGTEFDDFSSHSHQNCFDISPQAQKNRMILAGIMYTAGFEGISTEWWHFQLKDLEAYPILKNEDAPYSMLL